MRSQAATKPIQWSRARFYTIHGRQLPSVTTILDVIAKPALGPWYAKEERRYFEAAMLEVLARPGARDPEYVLTAVADAVTGVKAADRERQKAAAIGTAIHAEAFLQNIAYRHAAERLGLPSEQGLIVRLPKLLDDPAWEVMTVPETLGLPDFLAALRLWRWQRHIEGRFAGTRPTPP